MPYLLAGIRDKIARGEDHLNELDNLARAFFAADAEAYTLASDFDQEQHVMVTRFRILHEPPLRFGVIAGEAIGQFRSSLDHLGLQLARLRHPNVMSANFPIYTDRRVYTLKTGRKNLSPQDICRRLFRPEDLARIERMQPYTQTVPASAGLAILQRLSNLDKHAVVHTPFARLERLRLSPEQPDMGIHIISSDIRSGGPLEDGAELARWQVVVPRGAGDDVKVTWLMRVGLGYGDEGFTFRTLKDLSVGVIGIIDEFEAAIPAL